MIFELPALTLVSSHNISRGRTIAKPVTTIVFTPVNNILDQSLDRRCWSHLKRIYVSIAVRAFSFNIV